MDLTENRRFLGKELDKESGLICMGARFLDPKTGRFTQPDPVELVDPATGRVNQEMLVNPQRQNRYVYGLNNPYKYVDPDGNVPIETVWDVGNVLYDIVVGDWVSLGADATAMLIPYVPAGATKALKAGKAAKKAGRTGKQTKLRKLAGDSKVSSADRGWIKNEMRHVKNGNRKTIRLPGNSRNSQQGGKVLAHSRGKRAKDGHSYEQSHLQDTDLHKLEHKHGGY